MMKPTGNRGKHMFMCETETENKTDRHKGQRKGGNAFATFLDLILVIANSILHFCFPLSPQTYPANH